jgi:CubicO group peptidase (beta-lactamase class C family)
MSIRLRRAILSHALLPALGAAGRAAAPPAFPPAAARVTAALDSVAGAAVRDGRAAGLVAIVTRGADTLVARAYGHADVENDAPLSVDHVFQLASITKQFTAAAVLTLVDAGRVALDAPVARYLPDTPLAADPATGRAVTVRQLLAHTSGVPDYAESRRMSNIRRLDVPPDTLLTLVRGTAFYFPPGDQMRYSNTGFVLLGQLIERVSGEPYAAYVEAHVLRPAGLDHTQFCDPQALVPRLARGYAYEHGELRPAAFISPNVPWAAGGFCGTAGDLTMWNRAVHAARGGAVLSAASYAAMTTPGTVRGGRRTRYGLGVELIDIAGRRAASHGGDINGFTTYTAYLPDDSLSVTVLVNTQGPTRADAVAATLVQAALGSPSTERATAPAPRLTPFAGHYADDVTVEVTGGAAPTLRLTRGPLPPVLLHFVKRETDEWIFTDGRARYAFERPTEGDAASVADASPAIWADLGVALVRWKRTAR